MARLEIIRAFERLPYAAQVASPELAARIFVDGMDPILDPRWQESGADSPQEYAYWTGRACGVACVKMCVEAFGGPILPLVAWARRGVELGGYLSELRPDGSQAERGWLHSALADLMRAEGLQAEPRALAISDFPTLIAAGSLIIASVSYEIGTPLPVTRKGGHLVVVYGIELQENQVSALILNNPSGRTSEMQAGACIPVQRFEQGYTGRAIVVSGADSH